MLTNERITMDRETDRASVLLAIASVALAVALVIRA